MLMTNAKINQENAFKDTYCDLVAKRLGLPRWCYPNKSKNKIPWVIENCVACGISSATEISLFVKAQFHYFDYKACLQLFKMKYPPISVFLNDNARHRYREHVLREESYIPAELMDVEIMNIINKETANNRPGLWYAKEDKIKFALVNGSLSTYTLAYSMLKNQVPTKMAKDCVSYAKQYVTDDLEQNYYQAVNRVAKMLNIRNVKGVSC